MLIGATIAALVYLFFPRPEVLTERYQQAENVIKKEVHDETRQKEALNIVQKAEAAEVRRHDELKKSFDSLATVLLETRASTSSEIEAALAPIDAAALDESQKQLDIRFQLKKVLTENEWSQVFPPPGGGPAADAGTGGPGK